MTDERPSETLIECTEDEFHYTEHVWICHSTDLRIEFVCEHCSTVARLDGPFPPDHEGINLKEYGGCDTPRLREPNSAGRQFHDGKWWKQGPSWHELYIQAWAIVDPAWCMTCTEAISSHARCVLFLIPPLRTYVDIVGLIERYVAKDNKDKGIHGQDHK